MPDRSANKKVNITISSRQSGEETVQVLSGESFVRKEAVYIRYVEPELEPGSGTVRTLVKVTDHELKIMRHGSVESEQTFQVGRKLPGFYRSAYTSFNLSTDTLMLKAELKGAYGRIVCEYDLYVYEDLSGHFAITLHIQEEV